MAENGKYQVKLRMKKGGARFRKSNSITADVIEMKTLMEEDSADEEEVATPRLYRSHSVPSTPLKTPNKPKKEEKVSSGRTKVTF